MGEALSADGRHRSLDDMSEEPWIELEEARARSSNPAVTTLRYHRQDPSRLAEDYEETGRQLGQGLNGAVILAIGRRDGRKYALKHFNKRTMTAESLKLLKREVEVYLSVDHPGIARLCDVYECSEKVTLVMECCSGGELFERLLEQDRCCFSEPDAALATQQMLRSVSYLHAHHIVHRDLKLENFLYESAEVSAPLKLIDFGFAKVWEPDMPKMHTCCGSLAYVSPDILRGQGYTNKCDLWSLGVIAFMLLAGYAPFSGDGRTMKALIKAGDIDWSGKSNWHEVSAEAQDFVRSLLTCDPEQRLDARTALSHPWLLKMTCRTPSPVLQPEVLLSMQQYACASRLRRAALQLVARELSAEETLELRGTFLGLDKDNTGTILLQDFVDAVRKERAGRVGDGFWSYFSLWPSSASTSRPLSPSPSSARQDAVEQEAVELFQALDPNGDGELHFSDFLAAALAALPRPREPALRRAFARLDADGSGAVGEADLRRLGGALGGAGAELLAASGAAPEGGELGFGAFARLLGAAEAAPAARM